jgi:hypothetical protein
MGLHVKLGFALEYHVDSVGWDAEARPETAGGPTARAAPAALSPTSTIVRQMMRDGRTRLPD